MTGRRNWSGNGQSNGGAPGITAWPAAVAFHRLKSSQAIGPDATPPISKQISAFPPASSLRLPCACLSGDSALEYVVRAGAPNAVQQILLRRSASGLGHRLVHAGRTQDRLALSAVTSERRGRVTSQSVAQRAATLEVPW